MTCATMPQHRGTGVERFRATTVSEGQNNEVCIRSVIAARTAATKVSEALELSGDHTRHFRVNFQAAVSKEVKELRSY